MKALALIAAGLLAATAALAQGQGSDPGQEPEVKKVYGKDTLTPAQIRDCLRLSRELDDREQKVADYEKTLTDYREKIAGLADDLQRRRQTVDGEDPKAVNEYNADIDRHRKMIETYNEQFLPTLEQRQSELNQQVGTYNADCADKAYFEDDWQAALKELDMEDPREEKGGGRS